MITWRFVLAAMKSATSLARRRPTSDRDSLRVARGIVLLLLYLELDDSDDRPLIIDQQTSPSNPLQLRRS
jgi:hypothetical protein